MNKVRLIIVEDEMIVAEDMRQILEDLGYEVVGLTGDAQEAKRLFTATNPDLALIDITLGTEQHGLSLASFVKDEVNIPFIFCTSHADQTTVKEAGSLEPNGYLVKPFDEKDLYTSIEIALTSFTKKNTQINKDQLAVDDFLFIKEGQRYVKVIIGDILYLSPEGNYTNIHMDDDKKYVIRSPLKDFHQQLPEKYFYRTHRSFVVNIDKITAIDASNVYLSQRSIPLGKGFRDDLLSRIKKLH